jgi:hypothetical protein
LREEKFFITVLIATRAPIFKLPYEIPGYHHQTCEPQPYKEKGPLQRPERKRIMLGPSSNHYRQVYQYRFPRDIPLLKQINDPCVHPSPLEASSVI